MDNREIMRKLQEVEAALQSHDKSKKELKAIVFELRTILQALDKDFAIAAEKQSHLFYRIDQLDQELKIIEGRGEKGDDRQRDFIEKALMAVLGGLLTYILSNQTG